MEIHLWKARPISEYVKVNFSNVKLIHNIISKEEYEQSLYDLYASHWSHYVPNANRPLLLRID